MKNIKYPCRIYALEVNLHGEDSCKFQASANNDQELLKKLQKIRKDFQDTYKELDEYVCLTDNEENWLNVKPSTVLKNLGGEEEKAISLQIKKKCQFCFYKINDRGDACRNFGKTECKKYISVDKYWASPEGQQKLKKAEEKEKEYWESQPPEKREFHELYERYSELLQAWFDSSDNKKKELDVLMDQIVPRLKELDKTLKNGFIDWRTFGE